MSGLAHFLEDEGIATTGISLVREHTVAYRPPRFLWVPFPLGRPFGVPGDARFQHEVLAAALALLEREDGPVLLEDFPRGAPAIATGEEQSGWVCPVSFPPPPRDPADLSAALRREVEQLAPWYELSVTRRGRTTVGASGLAPEEMARFVAGFVAPRPPARYRADLSSAENLKLACEDLKAYYQEAAMTRPGNPDLLAMTDWLWGETTLGRLFLDLAGHLAGSEQPEMRDMARYYFIPRMQAHRLD